MRSVLQREDRSWSSHWKQRKPFVAEYDLEFPIQWIDQPVDTEADGERDSTVVMTRWHTHKNTEAAINIQKYDEIQRWQLRGQQRACVHCTVALASTDFNHNCHSPSLQRASTYVRLWEIPSELRSKRLKAPQRRRGGGSDASRSGKGGLAVSPPIAPPLVPPSGALSWHAPRLV